jgi:hypothetical protein
MRQASPMRAPLIAAVLLAACRPTPHAAHMIAADLISELPRAECRPASACEPAHGADGPAIRVPSPSRMTWILRLPHEGRFQATITAATDVRIGFRVGVADERTYEQLAGMVLARRDGTKSLDIDLSPYAGRKWSIFYHPDRIAWRLILSADAVDGVPGAGFWGAPRVMTTREGEAEYQRR